MTPYQLGLYAEGAGEGIRAVYRKALWASWHSAAFGRAKKMPRLDRALRRLDRKKRQQMSDEQMWKVFQMHNAALGGEDRRAKKSG